MNKYAKYDAEVGFHWDHLIGCLIVACTTFLAIVFHNVVWIYDIALETERLVAALLFDKAPLVELFDTAPPGQILISFFVFLGDSAVGRLLPEAAITHDLMRVIAAAYATYACLSGLIRDSRWSSQDTSKFYSNSLTLLVVLGPFALLISQVGVSTMVCLALAAPLLRVVFAIDLHSDHIDIFEPIYLLIIVAFAGWPGILLALFLSVGCLIQSFMFRDKGAALISAFTFLLGLGISVAIMALAPGWPAPAPTWAMYHVFLAMGLPFIVVALALLAPDLLRAKDNLQWFTLPIITMLALVALAVSTGDNLLAAAAMLLLAYSTMWALITPSFIHARNDPDYRPRETIWAILVWLIGPIAVLVIYSLSADAVWNIRTSIFSVLFLVLCLMAVAIFLRFHRNQNGSRWALVLTSLAAVLFVGGVAGVPLREAHGPAAMELAQQIWSLCREGEKPPAAVQVSAAIDPLTQRRLGPARRAPTDEADVLHIRSAYAAAPEGAIDLVQMRQPGHYIAAIVAPSEAARARCGSS